jgi:hypothetical protein
MKRIAIKMLRSLESFLHWFIIIPTICLALFVFILPLVVVWLSIWLIIIPNLLDEEIPYDY